MAETESSYPAPRILNRPILLATAATFGGLFVLVPCIVLASLENSDADEALAKSDTIALAGFVSAALIWSAGLTFAVRAFRQSKSVRQTRTWPIASILLNSFFTCISLTALSIFAWEQIHLAQRKQESRQSAAKINSSFKETQTRQLELAALASAGFTSKILELQNHYERTGAALTNPPVLDLSAVKTKDDLQRRRELIEKHIAASAALLDFSKDATNTLKRELLKYPLAPRIRTSILQGFLERTQSAAPEILALRETDLHMAKAMLDIINFLIEKRGEWESGPDECCAQFRDPDLQKDYQKRMDEIDLLSRQTLELQTDVRNWMKTNRNVLRVEDVDLKPINSRRNSLR